MRKFTLFFLCFALVLILVCRPGAVLFSATAAAAEPVKPAKPVIRPELERCGKSTVYQPHSNLPTDALTIPAGCGGGSSILVNYYEVD
jgi:hypothetical protein